MTDATRDDSDEVDDLVTVEWDEDLEIVGEISEPQLMISIEPQGTTHEQDSIEKNLDETYSLNSQEVISESTGNNDFLGTDAQNFLKDGVINIAPVSDLEADFNAFSDIWEEHSYSVLSMGLDTDVLTHCPPHINTEQNTADLKQCNMCFQQFPDKIKLKEHELEHRRNIFVEEHSIGNCNCCRDVGSFCDILTEEDDSVFTYECARCSAEFSDRESVENHTANKECGEGTVNRCYICHTDFVALFCLRRHIRESHLRKEPYVCDVCGRRFTNNGSYRRHMVIHTEERPHTCLVCGMSFKLDQNLKRHLMKHADERPFECTVCNKRFRVADHLKKHLLIHTGEKPFKCEICGAAFRGKYNLQKHEVTHTKGKNIKCSECDATFKHKEYLAQHMKVHMCTEKIYKCKICSKSFTRKILLDAHLKAHRMKEIYKETGEKPFECMFCDASYFTKVSLDRHVAQYHSKTTETFKCDECNASFVSKRKLIIHSRDHNKSNGTRSKACKTRENWETLNLSHEIDKPNSCEICGEKFRSVRALKWHRQAHNGVQRYTCEVCEESFSDLRSLKEHQWQDNGIKKFKCGECNETFKTKRDLSNHKQTEHSGLCKPCFVLLERL